MEKSEEKFQEKNSEAIRECFLKDTLDELFDIAHNAHDNALNIMTIREDKDFLIAQREKGRKGSMSSVDTTLQKKEQNIENW